MRERATTTYATLLSLYLAQSIPMSFFSTVIPVIMRIENYSLTTIGSLQLMKLPWIVKFLWAPLVDGTSSNSRHYRRWILTSELFYAAVIVAIGFLQLRTDFTLIVVLMLIAFTASATQDIATDAFAILVLREEQRSLGNSMQSAGGLIGTLAGSGILLIIYHHWGWQPLLTALALFVVLALLPIVLYRGHRAKAPGPAAAKVSPLEFIGFFRQPGIGRHVGLLFIVYAGMIGILTMVKPYLVDLGYTVEEIGYLSGIFGTACGALMTIPAALLIRKRGLARTVRLFPAVGLATALYFFALTFTGHPAALVWLAVALIWSCYAMANVFIFTLAMQRVRPGCEGTDFTMQIVVTHLSSLVIAALSGKLADTLTYRGLFAVEIGLSLAVLALVPLLFRAGAAEEEAMAGSLPLADELES